VVVWQSSTGLQVAVLTGHFQRVTCVAFTDDSSLLASGGEDGYVRVRSVAAFTSGQPSEEWTLVVRKITAKVIHLDLNNFN
jgi:WD40 repeat protein